MTLPLTVLIAAAGQPRMLLRTLQSLAECSLPAGYQGTLVVENGPRSGLREVVESFGRRLGARYAHAAVANKSHALNVGLRQIRAGLVVMLDDDVRVAPTLLNAYADGASGSQRGEFYGGPLAVDRDGEPPPRWLQKFLPKTARGWRLAHAQKTPVEKGIFLGPNWAAFAADLHAIGGFETRLGPGAVTGATGQETDAQRRLKAAGVRPFYLPAAEAWHFVRAECYTPEWIVARARRHGREWGIHRGRRASFANLNLLSYAARYTVAQVRIAWLLRFGGERNRLQAQHLTSMWVGRYEGLRLGQRWDEVACVPSADAPSVVSPPSETAAPHHRAA
jgi:GT2 family glycosyltransferase